MPKHETITVRVTIPEIKDFVLKYPHYSTHAKGEGNYLFKLIMQPSSFIRAVCATSDFDLPAVAGLAKLCDEAAKEHSTKKKLGNFDKQFIGAVTCALMELNGFAKKGEKRAIPHKAFTKGEMYLIPDGWKGF